MNAYDDSYENVRFKEKTDFTLMQNLQKWKPFTFI